MRTCVCLMALSMLSACVISPLTLAPAKPPAVKEVNPSLPPAIWPDSCVADWYAREKLPPCVEAWITDITKQQNTIEKKHKKHVRTVKSVS